jgi:hypothetical protein
MKKLPIILLILFSALLSSCEAIAGIFKAGVGFGIFIAALVVALLIYFISKMGKKN